MKKIIILILFASFLYAQVKDEKVIIKKIDPNVYELKGKLYGNFKDLSKLTTKKEVEDYLRANYDIGFTFSKSKSGYNVPIGKLNKWISGGKKDTLVFTSTITNPNLLKYYCSVWFKSKDKYFKADLSKAVIGKNISDYLCEPISVSIESKLKVIVKDTVTLTAIVEMEEECKQSLTYEWKYKTYDAIYDTISVTQIDTFYKYSNWKKWTKKRVGWISGKKNKLKFEIKNKKWDKRKWRVWVGSGVGDAVKSNNCIISVK